MSDIAIIGVGALFPKAHDARAFWDNIASGRDCIGEVPDSRIDPRYVDASSSALDRIPTRRGGTLGDSIRFDAGRFGIMPVAARGAEPDQMAALAVAAATIEDAGYAERPFTKERTAVILGRGGYLTPGMFRLHEKVRTGEQVLTILADVVPGITDQQLAEIRQRFQDGSTDIGPDTAIGLVPNLAASRIANRLDLQGPAYTVDAACASSLIAVEHAVSELRSRRCDLVVAGGVHLTHEAGFWSVFNQLGALSRTGRIRPFDRDADGLLIGEGIGMVALKRSEDAIRDGDRVYAHIAGVASASDGRASSVMVPRVDGQVLALERAWKDAGLDRSAVGLIEAHGTATHAGDRAELETLAKVFGDPGAVLGSVKSQIGHTMPAAGVAGLIKAAMAIYHGVLPPSLHVDNPHPLLEGTRWRVLGRSEPWEGERVAGVNAFGFGGINAHVVLKSAGAPVKHVRASRRAADRADVDVLLLAADTPEALAEALDRGDTRGGRGTARLALLDPTPERIALAIDLVQKWKPRSGRKGIWFRPDGGLLHDGKMVFLFPGIEAAFAPEVKGLAKHFGRTVPSYMEPTTLEETGRGVVGLGRFLHGILGDIGLTGDLYAGHSIGEWTAMLAAGALSDEDVDAFLEAVPVGELEVAGVQFAAAGCGIEVATEAIAGLENIAISHDNCPHQVLLCGHDASVDVARSRLVKRGVMCQVLPFRSGFHSPLFKASVGPHIEQLHALPITPAKRPLYSATIADRFPDDPDAIRQLALEHLVAPLRWRELLLKQYADGGRVFVQLGTGSLVNFVKDTLSDVPHAALSVLSPRQDGLVGLRNLLMALFVEGLDVTPDILTGKPSVSVDLPLGTPFVHIDGVRLETAHPDIAAPEPIQSALQRTLSALRKGPIDVVKALQDGRATADRITLSQERIPALEDHSFFPQPVGWPSIPDRHPVVPMTMTLELLMDIAQKLAPDRVVTEIADVELLRWLSVHPEIEIERRARVEGDWVRAEIVGYASARVRLAPDFSPGEGGLPDLESPVAPVCTAHELYTDRWMFHGPAYQGVSHIGDWDSTGVDGQITVPAGPGSLLDNAGQLIGYWLIAHAERDRLAMPKGIDRVQFFGPAPDVGSIVDCRVRIVEVEDRTITADTELRVDGELYCRITNWADHRFSTGPRIWAVMQAPEHHTIALEHPGFWFFDDQSIRAPSRDWLARRYLTTAQREQMAASRTPRQFLNGEVARVDALRAHRWAAGEGPLFPVEAAIDGLFTSVATHGQRAVAAVHTGPVGIGLSDDAALSEQQARAAFGSGAPESVEVAQVDGLICTWMR